MIVTETTARDAVSEAIRYWEPRRLLYNAVLLVVLAVVYVTNLPGSREGLGATDLQLMFVLAVLANVAYCAAYPVDVIVQLSSFRAVWLRFRWILLIIGLAFAAILANFFAHGLFARSA